MRVVRRIAEQAASRQVDFMIVAGDMFEDHNVDDLLVREVTDVLNSLDPMPVFIIPGNHDFWRPGGIWEGQGWHRAGSHVRLLVREEEVKVGENTFLYPCPLRQKRSSIDPTMWIPSRREGDDSIRIGIAHGSLATLSGQISFPIDAGRAERAGLDYLALGDWHGTKVAGRCAYPGTPEQTNFGEENTGNVLIVELRAGSTPRIEAVGVGETKWLEFSADVREWTDMEHLERQLRAATAGARCLLRVRTRVLSGDAELLKRLKALRRTVEEETLFLDWPDESLRVLDIDGQAVPSGLLAEVDGLLASMKNGSETASADPNGSTYAAEDAAEARYLLRDYLRGGTR